MNIQTLIAQMRAADEAEQVAKAAALEARKQQLAAEMRELLGDLAWQLYFWGDVSLSTSGSTAFVRIGLAHWHPAVRRAHEPQLGLELSGGQLRLVSGGAVARAMLFVDGQINPSTSRLFVEAESWYQRKLDDLRSDAKTQFNRALVRLPYVLSDDYAPKKARESIARLIDLDSDNANEYRSLLRDWLAWYEQAKREKDDADRKREADRQRAIEEARALVDRYRAWDAEYSKVVEARHDLQAALQRQLDNDLVVYWRLEYGRATIDNDGEPHVEVCDAILVSVGADLRGPHRQVLNGKELVDVTYANPIAMYGPFITQPSRAPAGAVQYVNGPMGAVYAHPAHGDLAELVQDLRERMPALPKAPTVSENDILREWLGEERAHKIDAHMRSWIDDLVTTVADAR